MSKYGSFLARISKCSHALHIGQDWTCGATNLKVESMARKRRNTDADIEKAIDALLGGTASRIEAAAMLNVAPNNLDIQLRWSPRFGALKTARRAGKIKKHTALKHRARKHTTEEIDKAIDGILSGEMTRVQAAEFLGVSRHNLAKQLKYSPRFIELLRTPTSNKSHYNRTKEQAVLRGDSSEFIRRCRGRRFLDSEQAKASVGGITYHFPGL